MSSKHRALAAALGALSIGFVLAASGCPGTLENKDDFSGVPYEILGPSCAKSGCHDAKTASAHLDLSPDDNLRARIVNVRSSPACTGLLVDTAHPEQSLLYTKCGPNPTCGTQMPQTGSLSTTDIADLLAWIKTLKP